MTLPSRPKKMQERRYSAKEQRSARDLPLSSTSIPQKSFSFVISILFATNNFQFCLKIKHNSSPPSFTFKKYIFTEFGGFRLQSPYGFSLTAATSILSPLHCKLAGNNDISIMGRRGEVEEGQMQRLILNLQPGASSSFICSHLRELKRFRFLYDSETGRPVKKGCNLSTNPALPPAISCDRKTSPTLCSKWSFANGFSFALCGAPLPAG
ncbi:hypothetical protein M501DRAFT_28173 [Patellaria atrata CBS 101060]|uniref:Uncharacterized protein n=1 Tax=Patellaria atrata CBS 101060 TaxID=1346257 RepID=A0A9P4SHV9_9PEZI|nr:hypothetical protein M501DRAFT_28173 [Patellaria atrata CBS 101060]